MAIKLGGGGGVSVPIGGTLSLLDTAATVTKGSEVFLRTGQTAASATYPNAPVKSFVNTGTLTAQNNYDANVSPWRGQTTPFINIGGAMSDSDSSSRDMYICSYGYVNQFTGYGSVFVRSRYLRDGVIFASNATENAITPVNWRRNGQAQGANVNSGNNIRAFISGDGGNGGKPAIAYLSDDLQTHYGTFTLTKTGDYPTAVRVKAQFTGANQISVLYDAVSSGSALYVSNFPTPSAAQVSAAQAGDYTTVSIAAASLSTITNQSYWEWVPEIVPWFNAGNAATYQDHVGVRCNRAGVSGQQIFYFNCHANNVSSNLGHTTYYTYDTAGVPNNSNTTYRAPYANHLETINMMRYSQATPYGRSIFNTSTQNHTMEAALSASGYAGYAYKNASTVYFGHTVANKAYAIHPTTSVAGTTIDLSSQAAPYRFAHHNNVLYNLNGTNIHTYNTTSGAFIQTFNISGQVSGTNAVGLAHDGSNLYVLDGSNSKIHKYNATGSSYVSFVTLSDTLHSTETLRSLAVDISKGVFWVQGTSNTYLYALNGTPKNAFASIGNGDMQVHDSHVVCLGSNSGTITKIATVDVVGNPSGGVGTTSTTYYRVA